MQPNVAAPHDDVRLRSQGETPDELSGTKTSSLY
jgi:hypothetical protein